MGISAPRALLEYSWCLQEEAKAGASTRAEAPEAGGEDSDSDTGKDGSSKDGSSSESSGDTD